MKGSKWKERAREDRPPGGVLGKHVLDVVDVLDVIGKSFARDVLSEDHWFYPKRWPLTVLVDHVDDDDDASKVLIVLIGADDEKTEDGDADFSF